GRKLGSRHQFDWSRSALSTATWPASQEVEYRRADESLSVARICVLSPSLVTRVARPPPKRTGRIAAELASLKIRNGPSRVLSWLTNKSLRSVPFAGGTSSTGGSKPVPSAVASWWRFAA